MAAVRSFEELAVENERHSIIKDAKKYAAEGLELQLWLNFPNPVAFADGKEVEAKKVKQAICKPRQQAIQSTVSKERWQGKLIKKRWDDERVKLEECFAWLSSWKNAPSIPSLEYKSFTKDCYLPRFTTTEKQNHKPLLKNVAYAGIPWRMRCSTFYLAVYSALAQTKYQQKHNNAFKILFFEVLRSLDVITKVEP